MKDLYELKGEGTSIRGIARELGISRNSVRKYLRSEGVPQPQGRPERPSKLDPYKEYIDGRLAEGLENCVVLLRELKERGYGGGYSILKDYVRPYRRLRQPKATMRFETGPGEQAQVDWGSMPYVTGEGGRGRLWALESLGMKQAAEVLDNRLDAAARRQVSCRPLGSRGVGPPGAVSAWPTCPSAAPWRTSTSPSSPPSTSGK